MEHSGSLTVRTALIALAVTVTLGVAFYFAQRALLMRGHAFGVYLSYVVAFLLGRTWSRWGRESGWPAAIASAFAMAIVWNTVVIAAARPTSFDIDDFAIYRFTAFLAAGAASMTAIGDRAAKSARIGATLFGMAIGVLGFYVAPMVADLQPIDPRRGAVPGAEPTFGRFGAQPDVVAPENHEVCLHAWNWFNALRIDGDLEAQMSWAPFETSVRARPDLLADRDFADMAEQKDLVPRARGRAYERESGLLRTSFFGFVTTHCGGI